jgi:uncharacterized membrane protein
MRRCVPVKQSIVRLLRIFVTGALAALPLIATEAIVR